MSKISNLQARRRTIIKAMDGIGSMRKGTLNAMHQKVVHKDGEVVMKGPYYVLTRKGAGGKTATQSIPVKDVPHIQQEVDNYKEFRRLSDEYIEVCENISLLADVDDTKKNC